VVAPAGLIMEALEPLVAGRIVVLIASGAVQICSEHAHIRGPT
jgi:hypothetical protein